ncbi:uncharacterized protein [Temnothorax nylanderi]|uniref:uncharacterized protein isoform X1 n=1 Tax=Temnothorax nylanderi TaxID=102681 RepID=UPI003A8B08FB
MEFTKPEDSEQRMANPWVKKMQEISRQEREKWAAYRRNVKLTLDNVEETTKAGKLTNDKSITLDPATLKPLVQDLSADQNTTNVKDSSGNRLHSSLSKQYVDTNVDGASNKKFKSNGWSTDIRNSSEKFLQKTPITGTHQRHKDYEISDIKEDPFFKRNATTDYEKSELEEDHLSSIINSHPEQSISQQLKDSHILKSSTSTHRSFTKSLENDKNLNYMNSSKESPIKKYSKQFNFSRNNKKESSNDNKEVEEKTAYSLIQKSKRNDNVNSHPAELVLQQSKIPHVPKSPIDKNLKKFSEPSKNLYHKIDFNLPVKKYPRQSSPSQNDNKENNEDNKKDDEKIIAARSLMWKSKEDKHNAEGKDVTEKLNHEISFHSGRWGMSVSSPPVKFLKDMSRRSKHRKNEEQVEEDGKRHLFGRWGMSVASPPKEFFEDISMHRGHGTERFTAKTGSRPNEVKGSSDDRPPIHQSHRNLQTTLVQQLMTDEHYKKLVGTLLGKVPNGLYDFKYPDSNWNNYPTDTDLNNDLFLGFLQALRSYVWQDDMDIPMSCRMRIPYASFRI